MLATLPDKIHPEHCALLVVDVQNDFCAGTSLWSRPWYRV
jgi:hypothetical protein